MWINWNPSNVQNKQLQHFIWWMLFNFCLFWLLNPLLIRPWLHDLVSWACTKIQPIGKSWSQHAPQQSSWFHSICFLLWHEMLPSFNQVRISIGKRESHQSLPNPNFHILEANHFMQVECACWILVLLSFHETILASFISFYSWAHWAASLGWQLKQSDRA